nr:MAG TPA: hypothetical protein [Caudoviricetes sp.]
MIDVIHYRLRFPGTHDCINNINITIKLHL